MHKSRYYLYISVASIISKVHDGNDTNRPMRSFNPSAIGFLNKMWLGLLEAVHVIQCPCVVLVYIVQVCIFYIHIILVASLLIVVFNVGHQTGPLRHWSFTLLCAYSCSPATHRQWGTNAFSLLNLECFYLCYNGFPPVWLWNTGVKWGVYVYSDRLAPRPNNVYETFSTISTVKLQYTLCSEYLSVQIFWVI